MVLVNGLEQSVEPLDDVQVRIFELFINFDKVDVTLNSFIAFVLKPLIKQIVHIEKDSFKLALFILLQPESVFLQLGFQHILCPMIYSFDSCCLILLSSSDVIGVYLLVCRFKEEHIWDMV